ncbi:MULTISPECIES: hypothetical protein [Streptomyces]|uniref:Uncharacterized protein n=2 Tax=Streptomyces TaxID=1883 RepID=A0ABV9JBQ5_9ACTN
MLPRPPRLSRPEGGQGAALLFLVGEPSGVARGPAVAREEHRRRPIPSPAARGLSHPPTSLFFLLWGVDSGA